ncbi:MAG: hypothetical protein ABJM29_12015 [Rhizobiaceae bacterium]
MTAQPAPVDYSDDVNLFEVLQTIWDGKIFIVTVTLVAAALGSIVGQVMPDKYRLSVPYWTNYNSLEASYLCVGARNQPLCRRQVDLTSDGISSQFEIKSNKLVLKRSPRSKEEAEELIVGLDKYVTNNSERIFDDVNHRLAYINTLSSTETPSDVLMEEAIKLNYLMRQYQSGLSFVRLGDAEFENGKLASHYILLIFAVLGLAFSTLVKLTIQAYRNWKSSRPA